MGAIYANDTLIPIKKMIWKSFELTLAALLTVVGCRVMIHDDHLE